MNALVPVHALTADEIELMTLVLGRTRDGRNRLWLGPLSADLPMIRDLAARGMMTAENRRWGNSLETSVTTLGARELVRLGAVALADLAEDVERVLERLLGRMRYRDDLRQRFGEACAADLCVWDHVADEPYARVAAAVLLKRGVVEQRGPEDPKELAFAGPDGLFIRAVVTGGSAR